MGLLIKLTRMPLKRKILLFLVTSLGIYALVRYNHLWEQFSTVEDRINDGVAEDTVEPFEYEQTLTPDFNDNDVVGFTKEPRVVVEEEEQVEANTGDDVELHYNMKPAKKSVMTKPEKRMNVLFIIADDLRPQIGAYFGRDYASPFDKKKLHTPNMDKLAEESLLLKRAYTQYSLCGPSRASILTSRRPDTTKVFQNFVHWRESGGNFTTLPQYFKQHGYASVGIGKVFHVDGHPNKDDPISWTVPPFHAPNVRHVTTAGVNWESVTERQREREPLEDEVTVLHATKVLQKLATKAVTGQKPFFMALGFYRPHVPQICPAEFFKLYPLETAVRFMAEEEWQSPKLDPYCNMAPLQDGVSNANLTRIPEAALRKLRAAYFACVSYVDYLIGTLMKTLDELQLSDNTIVTLVADHGFHLGENNWYSKYTTNDIALHVPLMMRIPGLTDKGVESRSLVELLDMFPTIVEAAGLPPLKECPDVSTDIKLCTEGKSLLPLIRRPQKPIRNAAYSQVSRGKDMTEYSIRSDKYRYTDFASHRRVEQEGGLYKHHLFWDIDLEYSDLNRSLYDHDKDPEERVNLIDDPEYENTVEKLRERLQEKFTAVHDYPVNVYNKYDV